MGRVCKADYPLEFFVTYRDRSYEAIVASDVRPSIVHAALLALGAEPGHPAQFQPEFEPPAGAEVAIEVRWKDADGKTPRLARPRLGSQHRNQESLGRELGIRRQPFDDRRANRQNTIWATAAISSVC